MLKLINKIIRVFLLKTSFADFLEHVLLFKSIKFTKNDTVLTLKVF